MTTKKRCCSACGSPRIQRLAWVEENTNAIKDTFDDERWMCPIACADEVSEALHLTLDQAVAKRIEWTLLGYLVERDAGTAPYLTLDAEAIGRLGSKPIEWIAKDRGNNAAGAAQSLPLASVDWIAVVAESIWAMNATHRGGVEITRQEAGRLAKEIAGGIKREKWEEVFASAVQTG